MTVTPSSSGEGGIRTLDDPEAIPVFETGAFNRSATSPVWSRSRVPASVPERKPTQVGVDSQPPSEYEW